ncbi:MAG: hypothetical protein ABUR63_04385 [Verrucomicrobiota bacterium]
MIAVVVAAGELSSPVTSALRLAAQESLGPAAVVHVLETPEPGKVDPIAIERSVGARAVAVVIWREPGHLHAVLRVHVSGADRWTVREIAFSPGDSLAERGRNLGLAISSASPAPALPHPSADTTAGPLPAGAAPADQPAPAEPPESAPATAARPALSAAASNQGAPGPVQGRGPADRSGAREASVSAPADAFGPRSWFRDESLALGASAVAAVGLGGSGSGVGAAVEAVLPLGSTLAFRFAGEVRTGPVAALSGTDLVALVEGGLEWWRARGERTGFGARADVMVLRHQVTGHAMGLTETHARVQPGAEIAGQVGLHLSARVDLVLALGLELAFGSTDLRTGTTPAVVATIPPLRAISQLGLRLDF